MTAKEWKKFHSMRDEDVDTSDIPELKINRNFWKKARVVMPQQKVAISFRMDSDVLKWFKSHGNGYQSRMMSVLRSYMDAHTSP